MTHSRLDAGARVGSADVRTEVPPSKTPSINPDEFPKPADIERQYPGFRKAYDEAFYASQARSEARIHRRCLVSVPENVHQVRWDSVETFEPNAEGTVLVRTKIEFVPGSEEQAPFTKCLNESIPSDGSTKITLPSENPILETVHVHNGGIVYISDYTKEYLATELVGLRESVANPALSADQRAVLQDQLELWECYYQRGMEHRKECLSR